MKKESLLHKINLFVRSLIFSIIMIVTIIMYSFVCLFISPLPLRYRCAWILTWTNFIIWLLKKLCYVDYNIQGLSNIPTNRNGVVLSKHQSMWEAFILPNFFKQAAIIVKRELLWIPFFGWGLATVNPIAINRRDKASAMEQIIIKGKKSLEEGRWIIIFPEGTRTTPGKEGHYRAGGARLAVAAGCPVIPVAHNAGRYWPKRGFIKNPGTVQMVIGPLIETTNRTPEDVTKEVKNWIEDTLKKIDNE